MTTQHKIDHCPKQLHVEARSRFQTFLVHPGGNGATATGVEPLHILITFCNTNAQIRHAVQNFGEFNLPSNTGDIIVQTEPHNVYKECMLLVSETQQ